MSTPRKPKTPPAVTDAGPDLEQMEAVITEAATMTAPMVTRAASERNRMLMRVKELERELADFADRRALLKSMYEAADTALAAHEADISEALALNHEGLSCNVVSLRAGAA